MRRYTMGIILLMITGLLDAQVQYSLVYTDSSGGKVLVEIKMAKPLSAPLDFVMPRYIPGNYAVSKYDLFVENLIAHGTNGETCSFEKSEDNAPRWTCSAKDESIATISYEVTLDKMEKVMFAASDRSIVRSGFAGILNYSVFGWVDGTETQPVKCSIKTFKDWPIFSTIVPARNMQKGELDFTTDNYFVLADAQTFLGTAFRVKEYPALVPLYIVSYLENGEEYLDDFGWQEAKSMEILKDYFGNIPFKNYSLLLRNAIPPTSDEKGSFGMEHFNSSTFFGDTSGRRKGPMTELQKWKTISTYLHHMGHAYIPLRSYGDAYLPHVLEIPPVINNIWFNEGFM